MKAREMNVNLETSRDSTENMAKRDGDEHCGGMDETLTTMTLQKYTDLKNAVKESLSLLKGEKEFPEDLTIWGPNGKNIVRIEKVIELCEDAIKERGSK